MVSLNLDPNLRPPEEPIEGLEGEALHEAVKAWFLLNFENPAENTPFNSREGGYQYIWGGPHEAREEIEGYFGYDTIPEKDLDAIVSDLERDSWEWAPSSSRIYDEDEPEDDYGKLQKSLDLVERRLDEVTAEIPSMGHNGPPELLLAYTEEDEAEIRQLIELLRSTEEALIQNADKVFEASKGLQTKSEKIKDFCKHHGNKTVEAFSAEIGKRSADAVLVGLGLALASAYEAVKALLLGFLSGGPPF